MKLKFNFKNLFLFLISITLLMASPFKMYAFKSFDTTANLALESSSSQKNDDTESTEDSGVFDFIKSNNNVKDFFYDGSALLYGGILLILISIFGIFQTLRPKKNKHKKRNTVNKKDNKY